MLFEMAEWWNWYTRWTYVNLSALREILKVELLKVGETFKMAIPNQAERKV